MFDQTGPHFCPVCEPVFVGRVDRRRQCGQRLVAVQTNYSGTGVDIAKCDYCNRTFEIVYETKVKSVKEIL